MNELNRLQDPWQVIKHDDCFQVVDSTGKFILAVTHRQGLHRSHYTHAGNYLNAREAERSRMPLRTSKPCFVEMHRSRYPCSHCIIMGNDMTEQDASNGQKHSASRVSTDLSSHRF